LQNSSLRACKIRCSVNFDRGSAGKHTQTHTHMQTYTETQTHTHNF